MLHRHRPATDFRVEKFAEFPRAGEARGHSGFLERGDQLAIGEDPAQLGFEPRDDGLRSREVTASSRILPARICGAEMDNASNIKSTSPASNAVIAAGAPRKGTCTASNFP